MADESEWIKLPLDDRCIHKVWKARLHGYTEAIKYFGTLDSKSPEFSKFLGIIKKFVVDTNAVAQEKGLDAVLAFLHNAASAHKTSAEVSSGVVLKCLNSSRTKTKEKGIEILMVCIELEKQEVVVEEVMKGLTNKQPKIVAACVLVLRTAIGNFGSKIISLKPIVKSLPKLFEHSDKNVREEAKQLAVEIYRWIGAVFMPSLQNIKPVQMKELEEEFEKIPNKAPKQIRFLKSQQAEKEKFEEAAGDDGESEEEEEARPEVDPFELLPAVDVLSKLPKDFFESIEAKKWQTRKEVLDNLLPLATSPKIEPGDFAELVRVLKKVLSKDTNVMIVTVATKCLCGLAIGLRKKFNPFAVACVGAILEKFKEKKVMVVAALRDAIDAIFLTTTLQSIIEDVLAALDSKNPSVRSETATFLARAIRHCTQATLPKSVLKPLSVALVKKIGDTSPEVRDAVALSLGTAMKVVGEKHLMPFISDLDKIKQDKIKECCENVELATGGGKKKKEKPAAKEPTKPAAAAAPAKSAGPSKAKPAKAKTRPASASSAGKATKSKKKTKASEESEKKMEPAYSPEDVDEKAADALPASMLQQLAHANWKERLAGMEELTTKIHNMEKKDIDCQLYVRLTAKKPGYKDANFQVLKAKFALIGILAEKGKFSRTSAGVCIGGIVEKIGDIKQSATAKETMTSMAEACGLQFVALEAISYAFDSQKNPKNQSETINWFTQAIQEFGFTAIKVKNFISYIKKALVATNPAIRTSAISTVGVMYMYMGAPLRMLFEDEKPALLAQIDTEFQKVTGTSPPAPFRGVKKEEKTDDVDGDDGEDDGDEDVGDVGGGAAPSIQDLVPRVDISDQITSALIEELGDSKWKVRGQGLERVQTILNGNKFITSNLGELPTALKPRLSDTNKILSTNTANICTQLAHAIGPAVKVHVRTLVPGLLMLNCDSKASVRAASITALSAWEEQVGLAPFIEDELLNTVLAKESPFLRMEVFGWLEEKLAKYHTLPSDLALSVPILYAALEDRNPDVRKKAQGVLPLFMMHISYEKCVKMTNKLKPSSKTQVMQILEKQRPNIPAKPEKPGKAKKIKAAEEKKRPKTAPAKTESSSTDTSPVETTTAPTTTTKKKSASKPKAEASSNQPDPPPAAAAPPPASAVPPPAATNKKSKLTKGKATKSSKKQEEEDVGPPVILNNLKDKRFRDEDNLKVLKWNFNVPRDEIIDQLREQMQPCVNSSLFTSLFHADFKHHITAIATLKEAVSSCKEASIGALDIILKWVTLRFFDTNTTVNIKALEFLQVLFNMLADEDYSMHDYEAYAFLPYLILKIGENKENIRKMVRNCIKTITKIYPASKIFQFIIDGLKSKNARQRTECLDELGTLIDLYGINVCQPSPPKALKDIAVQISDRDNSVRSAALNTLVQAYAIVGEGIYKMVGRLNEKDVSLLEERIKRSSKKVKSAAPPKTAPSQESKLTKQDVKKSSLQAPSNDRPSTAPSQTSSNIRNSNVPQVFKLDLDGLGLNDGDSNDNIPQLEDMDHVQDLLTDAVKLPERRLQKPNLTVAQLDFIISQIASNDIAISLQSLKQLDEALQDSDRCKVLTDHVDQLVVTTSLQLRMAFSKYMSDENTSKDVIRMYRCLVALLMSLFQNRMLATKASKDVLCDLVNGLITVLIDNRLESFEEGPQVIRSINMLMVKVLDQSDPTNSMCALLKLLQEYVAQESSSQKFVQLIMKCLWRMVRSMPEIIHDINVERLLLSLHVFLKAFPSAVWKERTNDTPLRTIKTILHSLAKILGAKVLNNLVLINDKNSEVELYLKKIVKNNRKSVGGDHINGSVQETRSHSSSSSKLASPRRASARTNDILAEIFKRIGSKENTREGLAELFDFKCKYPDVDIEPFLKKTSPFFQSYIERGLKNIATEREKAQSEKQRSKENNVTSVDSISSSEGGTPANQDVSTSQLRDRLKVLRARCGLDNGGEAVQESAPVKQGKPELVSSSSIESDTPSGASSHQSEEVIDQITLGSSSSTSSTQAQVPNTNVDDLRKRLERIKKGGSMN
ncbi:cytoskeleton-associated protein 5-A-like isoform X2 [Antedon mediterranea]|uniref:cytoskeleton-associated protein 5-A-like isoform X2 n=1 Tax=Antedon mediterranea TaxID=105859 RepID=UPI003AF72CF4